MAMPRSANGASAAGTVSTPPSTASSGTSSAVTLRCSACVIHSDPISANRARPVRSPSGGGTAANTPAATSTDNNTPSAARSAGPGSAVTLRVR